jgi:glycine/D-amino acid oxidase-like deaminating enzyme
MSDHNQFKLRPPVIASDADQSYWLQSTGDLDDTPAPALKGSVTADVAIIGGGLTGLWTAIRILEADPDQKVTVLEADICGSGASGRNGGQIHSWFESLDRLTSVTGPEEALRLADATRDAIQELKALQDAGEIDMDLRLDGWIWSASSRAQERAWEPALERCQENGAAPYRRLDAAELNRRTGSSVPYTGVVEEMAGSLNPGKLMRNLKKYAIRKGVTIHERTPALSITPGGHARIQTPGGELTAPKVLIATNAWASSIPELRRKMYVVDSQVVVTEPIPDQLDALGWKAGEAICDAQNQVLYYQRTVDGRIVFGRGSGGTIFGDRIGAKMNRHPRWVKDSLRELRRVYPSLKDVKIDYDWLGPIDCVPAHVPMFGNLTGHENIYYAVGWNGTGLAQIPACSRILSSMVLGLDDQWAHSKLINQATAKSLPPEPIRYIGATIVRAALIRKNAAEIRDMKPHILTEALVRLMPKGTTEH